MPLCLILHDRIKANVAHGLLSIWLTLRITRNLSTYNVHIPTTLQFIMIVDFNYPMRGLVLIFSSFLLVVGVHDKFTGMLWA